MKKENQLANCRSLDNIKFYEDGNFTPGQYYWYREVAEVRGSKFIVKDDNDKDVEFDSIEFEYNFRSLQIVCSVNEWELRQLRDSIKIIQLLSDNEDKRRKLYFLHRKLEELVYNTIDEMKSHEF